MSDTLQLAKELIARRSLTPLDEGCLTLISARLEPLGFKLEMMRTQCHQETYDGTRWQDSGDRIQ